MTSVLTITDLRKKLPDELAKLIMQLQEQLRGKQFEARTGQLKKVHEIKALRRSIAKVQTVQHETLTAAGTTLSKKSPEQSVSKKTR